MKTLILIIITLLLAVPCFAGSGSVAITLSGTAGAAGGGTGVIGNIVHDNSASGAVSGYYFFYNIAPTTEGTVSYAHAYMSTGSTNTKVVLSIHDIGNESCTASTVPNACCTGVGTGTCSAVKLYSGSTTVASAAAQWVNIAVTGSTSLVAGKKYWLAFQVDKELTLFYYGVAVCNQALLYAHAMEDPAGTIGAATEVSICVNHTTYFNNTAGSPE
jgi:hypothetical protein